MRSPTNEIIARLPKGRLVLSVTVGFALSVGSAQTFEKPVIRPNPENWASLKRPPQASAQIANQTTGCSSMRTAGPAAWPPHPFLKLRAHPFDMLPPCLIFLDGDGPADPLVARERRYVFPSRQCLRVGRERVSKVSRKIMYDSSGDLNGCHRAISQPKGSSI